MFLGSIIILTLFVGLLYVVQQKSNRRHSYSGHRKHNSHNNSGAKKHNDFHCVETHHSSHCCQAIKDLDGKRFLSVEAPMLPLQNCDQANCNCDYVHHADRRSELRRANFGLQRDMYGQNGEEEHRAENRTGRRKSD